MKFSGIVAPLAVAGVASAAALPVQSLTGQLRGDLNQAKSALEGLANSNGPVDLSSVKQGMSWFKCTWKFLGLIPSLFNSAFLH